MVSFQNPAGFILFGILPILIYLFVKCLLWRRKTKQYFGHNSHTDLIIPGESNFQHFTSFVLIVTVLCAIIFLITNPQKYTHQEKPNVSDLDIIFVVDVSNSMLCNDIKPSRLEYTKSQILRLLPEFATSRIGIICFAGKSHLLMPLTDDYDATRLYISDISTDAVPKQGTSISSALKLCENVFSSNSSKNRVVLLFSDGENHDKLMQDDEMLMSESGIKVFTIGVGSETGAMVPQTDSSEFKKDKNGELVISRLNMNNLVQISESTGAKYFTSSLLNSPVKFVNALKINIGAHKITDDENVEANPFYNLLLIPSIIILIFEIYFSNSKRAISI